MTTNDTVKFTQPENDHEAREIMLVIEDRGDRVLVQSLTTVLGSTAYPIYPTFVYLKSDLTVIK